MKTRNRKGSGPLGRILMALVFIFLYAPIFVLIVFSFNATKSRTVWSGFTLKWYGELFHDATILNSLSTTLTVSVIAALVATIAGTCAAIGFFTMKKRWRSPLMTINSIPLMNADIVTGVSLCLLFVASGAAFTAAGNWMNEVFGTNLNLGFRLGFGTLLIAHITFNIPYVILSVMPKLQQLDKNLVDAAQDLGCTWFQAFRKVVIPQIMPGIVNGAIIAFTMSIDDFVISYFTAGHVSTLSMTIYAMTRKRISPKINAVSTLLFVSVLILLVIINVREMRQEERERKKLHGGQ